MHDWRITKRGNSNFACYFIAYLLLMFATVDGLDIKQFNMSPSNIIHNGNNNSTCLIDSKNRFENLQIKQPIHTHYCWIGWDKSFEPNPFIQLTLSGVRRPSSSYGLVIKSYAEQNQNISNIKEIISYTIHDGVQKFFGSLCLPVYEGDNIYIDLNLILGNVFMLRFGYSLQRIFLQQIAVIEKDRENSNYHWNKLIPQRRCSIAITTITPSSMTVLTTKTTPTMPKSEVELSDETIFVIRLSASLSVIGVFFLFTIVWCCLRKNNIIVDNPLRSKIYTEEDRLTKTNTNNQDKQQHLNNSDYFIGDAGKFCFCQTCMEKGNAILLENKNTVTNSNYDLGDTISFDEFTPSKNQKIDSESDTSGLDSPGHRYLDLPACYEDDSLQNVKKQKSRMSIIEGGNYDTRESKSKNPIENENKAYSEIV